MLSIIDSGLTPIFIFSLLFLVASVHGNVVTATRLHINLKLNDFPAGCNYFSAVGLLELNVLDL